ncbi:hypothetical protein [Actinocorallia sp. A-T 12471]|uniref:hypothetical protein n=1 Tax=Actinocorallia sp. A-T 12471 TaxID=3089813 RepID=UPI0029D1BEAA|nr:hypothetical protein [Actinocorallia sp. A-T 12471]MDX6740896.1 hypothetical protein [Actinocorallia sp. A-T 12471]
MIDVPVIERRLSWRPVLPVMVVFLAGGVCCGVLGVLRESGALLVVACVLGAAVAFLVAVTLGSRTVVGADGVHDRRPWSPEVFVAWSEVEDVVVSGRRSRVVALTRRGRRGRTLSAVRDGDQAGDGLGFDGLVAVIRHRVHRAGG